MADDALSLSRGSNGAVTETFLHETAVSAPELWRLCSRPPPTDLSLEQRSTSGCV